MKNLKFLVPIFLIVLISIALILPKTERGDYIFEKKISEDSTLLIAVVHNITKKEVLNNKLIDYLNNNDPNDVIYYHILDEKLFEDLKIGERVTIHSPRTLLTYPPEAIAKEIIRHDISNNGL